MPIPCSVLETFYFALELLQCIVDQTNLYAQQCMGDDKYTAWNKVTIEELNVFIGFMILMGLVQLPSSADYWSKDETFRYTQGIGS